MVLLKITYKLRAHHVAEYEHTFATQTLPLIRAHGLRFKGIWRTVVGTAQEYLELFEFDSIVQFDTQWGALMSDPRLREVFKITGPLVEDEQLALIESALPTEMLSQ